VNADEWNARYPIGTRVMAYPGVLPVDEAAGWTCERVETRTTGAAWVLGGRPVVLVAGEGNVDLDHVEPVPADAPAGDARG
jgi:hypothetical protein